MWPLSDRKICEQHLIAHSQWLFLRFQIELLHSVFCVRPTYEFLETYFKQAIIGEFWISVTLTFANAYTLISVVFRLAKSVRDLLFKELNNSYTEYWGETKHRCISITLANYILVVKIVFSYTCKLISVPVKIFEKLSKIYVAFKLIPSLPFCRGHFT